MINGDQKKKGLERFLPPLNNFFMGNSSKGYPAIRKRKPMTCGKISVQSSLKVLLCTPFSIINPLFFLEPDKLFTFSVVLCFLFSAVL